MNQIPGEETVAGIESAATAEIVSAATYDQLESIRIKYLGRKGQVAQIFDSVATLPQGERPRAGRLANELKKRLEELIEERKAFLSCAPVTFPTRKESDVTLPGKRLPVGTIHPHLCRD